MAGVNARRAAVRKNLTVIEEDEEETDDDPITGVGTGERIDRAYSNDNANRLRGEGTQTSASIASTLRGPRSGLRNPSTDESFDRVRSRMEREADHEHIRGLNAQLQETRAALKRTLAEIDMLRAHISSLEITMEERNSEVRRLRDQIAAASATFSAAGNPVLNSSGALGTVPVVGRDLLGMLRGGAAPHMDAAQQTMGSGGALKAALPSRLVELRNTVPQSTTLPTSKTTAARNISSGSSNTR
ncbi:hypothetical protein F1559_002412 [Cyanidiococcus yangmingshanensis]|uniref:Uncharacterized protein n=1 Tax=Cyanidiococcus yangmingshanensis TaxID=2690220 RepID=A0A7J7IBX0_9RHOD|nr:hypothetical protein F1559_002412 [Cyanidiococcus yangmingshanensis]